MCVCVGEGKKEREEKEGIKPKIPFDFRSGCPSYPIERIYFVCMCCVVLCCVILCYVCERVKREEKKKKIVEQWGFVKYFTLASSSFRLVVFTVIPFVREKEINHIILYYSLTHTHTRREKRERDREKTYLFAQFHAIIPCHPFTLPKFYYLQEQSRIKRPDKQQNREKPENDRPQE